MSEMEIRINKRSLERMVFMLIIIALAVFLFLKWDTTAQSADTEQVTTLQAENTALSAQVENLTAQVTEFERAAQLEAEAQKERDAAIAKTPTTTTPKTTTTEKKLSGDITVAWTISMDGDKLTRVVVSMVNGLDSTEKVHYKLYWDSFFPDTVNLQDDVTLKSGQTWSEAVVTGTEIATNPPENIDTLILTVTDSDGKLIDELEKIVR